MLQDLLMTTSRSSMNVMLVLWMIVFAVMVWIQSTRGVRTGLPLTYAFALTLLHWFGALVWAQPNYRPMSEVNVQAGMTLDDTYRGFTLAFFGLVSFAISSTLAPSIFRPRLPDRKERLPPQVTSQLPGTLGLISLSFFFVIGRIIQKVPGFSAITIAGTSLGVVSVIIGCHLAAKANDQKRFLRWLSVTSIFPLLTVVFHGFANSGLQAAYCAWMMVLRLCRRRMLAIAVLCMIMTGVLTLYVNYMRERNSIRASVWGNEGLSSRLSSFYGIFSNFEFISLKKNHHLETIDSRLNQNGLVGRAVGYINSTRIDFAEGGTLILAVQSVIPRVLWPSKPKTGGSGSLAGRYTGLKFSDSTSVGVGPVMEFYINYGIPGVIGGFAILGLIFGWVDVRAGAYLASGDYWTFTCWTLPALGLLQPCGALSEATGSLAANIVFVMFLHYSLFQKFYLSTSAIRSRLGAETTVRGSKAPSYR